MARTTHVSAGGFARGAFNLSLLGAVFIFAMTAIVYRPVLGELGREVRVFSFVLNLNKQLCAILGVACTVRRGKYETFDLAIWHAIIFGQAVARGAG